MKYIDKSHTYVDKTVKIGEGTIIYPNVILEGNTTIGKNCVIHMGCFLKDTLVKDYTIIYNSHIEDSDIGKNCIIGPYAYLRMGNKIGDNIKIGAFVEIKNTTINDQTKIPHLSYIGDATIGKQVNIGAGVITANYDGKQKYQTKIKDGAFIGCNTNLIAPIVVEKNAMIGAGATVNQDVPEDTLIIKKAEMVQKKLKENC